jgi:hypothetical protein
MTIPIGAAVYVVAKYDSGVVAEHHPDTPENGVDRDYAKRRERFVDGDLLLFPQDNGEISHILFSSVADSGEETRAVVKLSRRGAVRRATHNIYVTKAGHLYRRTRRLPLP